MATHRHAVHDRWNDDHALQSDYSAGISGAAAAPTQAGISRRPPAAHKPLPVPCVCGSYAVALDATGSWLDMALAGPPLGRAAGPRDLMIEQLCERARSRRAYHQGSAYGERKVSELRAELEQMGARALRARAEAAGIDVDSLPEAAEETQRPMYMSIAVGSGTYRYNSGHNAGMLVCGFGPAGRTGYQRDRGHVFRHIARARDGPVLPPGQYSAGNDGQWVITVKMSGQVTITFFHKHRLDGSARADAFWADPSQSFLGTRGGMRQAGQLILRPDGGFHEATGDPAHGASVQTLAHGRVALTGADLTRFDTAQERRARFRNHQHHGGAPPYHQQSTLDPSLLDTTAPGTRLLHVSHRGDGAAALDSKLATVAVKSTSVSQTGSASLPPWARDDEVDSNALAHAWGVSTLPATAVAAARQGGGGDRHRRIKAADLLPCRGRDGIPGAAPLWDR
jgi:hypothetical protein